MKRVLDMLAEILALPYSAFYLEGDPLLECVRKSKIWAVVGEKNDCLHELNQQLDEAYFQVAGYLNQHIGIRRLAEVRNQLHYAFNAKDIIECAGNHGELQEAQMLLNHYYIERLLHVSQLLLTTRNGRIVLRPWGSLSDALLKRDTEPDSATYEKAPFEPQRIEIWNSLLRCLPEDTFISAYAAIQLKENSDVHERYYAGIQILKGFGISVNMADVMLDKVLDAGMAETHLHAGASRSFAQIWESMLSMALQGKQVLEREEYQLPFKDAVSRKDFDCLAREAAVVRLLIAAYWRSGFSDMFGFLQSDNIRLQYQTLFFHGVEEIRAYGKPKTMLCDSVIHGIPFFEFGVSQDIWSLLDLPGAYRHSYPYLTETSLQCRAFMYIERKPFDTAFTALFLYYLRLRSKIYRIRVQDAKSPGLDYFQKYFATSTDYGTLDKEARLTELISTALQDTRVVKTEFRFSPPSADGPTIDVVSKCMGNQLRKGIESFIRQHLQVLVLKYGNDFTAREFENRWHMAVDRIRMDGKDELLRLLKCFEVDIRQICPHRLGIIYHLIKSGGRGERCDCFARSKTAISERQSYECFSFGKARFNYAASIKAISNLRDLCPAMSRLIVGIDAASQEIHTDPWVFAPAFRFAKKCNGKFATSGIYYGEKSLLGVSYHVGEDFQHPISGLRHIDEAIQMLNLHTGDRIGHGLALGIDLDRWFQANEMVLLPRIEWLENYLWLWHLLHEAPGLSGLADYFKLIEEQIVVYARQIYGRMDGITPESLYQAYLFKALPVKELIDRCCDVILRSDKKTHCFGCVHNVGFFPCLSSQTETVWTEKTLALSYHCSFYKQKMEQIIPVSCTGNQLELARYAQTYLLTRIADAGIVVESNPSSNATVGEINGMLSHPVWRFRSGDEQRIMTSINTDDPSVFNATIANEHALLYYVLRHHGLSVEDALNEVDEMRRIGMKSSFIREVQPIEKMLEDYEQIIRALRY